MRSVRAQSSTLAAAPRATWFLDAAQPSRDCALPYDSAHENRVMSTHIIATVILAVTYGAFWHDQPARPPNDQRRDPGFRLGRLVNRALEWLVLMPHLSNPAEKKESVFLNGKGHTGEANRVLSTSAPCSPDVEPVASNPRGPCWNATLDTAYLFKPKANTNELAAGKTISLV